MQETKERTLAAMSLAMSGVAWPSLVCAVTDALQTPLQRALLSSWCGAGPQAAEFLGHCAVCWIGAAALLAAAVAVQFGVSRQQARLAAV